MKTQSYFFVIMELCEGGELFEAIVGPRCRNFNERDVAKVMRQIVEAIDHMHNVLGVAHRDLKPENILIKDESKIEIKLIPYSSTRYIT